MLRHLSIVWTTRKATNEVVHVIHGPFLNIFIQRQIFLDCKQDVCPFKMERKLFCGKRWS